MIVTVVILLATCAIVILLIHNQQLRKNYYTGPEAITWLKNNQNPSALASSRFHTTEKATDFVNSLYCAGAVEVLIPKACIYDEPETIKEEGGPYANALLIVMPKEKSSIKTIIAICSSDIKKEGGNPFLDQFQKKIILWWD